MTSSTSYDPCFPVLCSPSEESSVVSSLKYTDPMTPPESDFVSSFITLPDGTSLLQLPAYVEAQYTDIPGLRTMASPEVFFAYDWVYFMPEVYLSLMGLLLLVWAVWTGMSSSYDYPALNGAFGILGATTLALTALLYLYGMVGIDREICQKTLLLDPLSLYLSFLVLAATIGTMLLSGPYTTNSVDKLPPYEINLLVLYAALSMIFLVQANDLLMVYLCVEFQSICLYILAASKKHSVLSVEAGLKYFVLGALASGIFLFGASLVYGLTGMTKLTDLGLFLQASEQIDPPFVMGLLCIGVGLMFKVGAAPFHFWVPDVYEGAPTPITAFFAVGPKMAMFGLLLRLLTLAPEAFESTWIILFSFCAGLSFIVGAWGALVQTKLKRLFAYSSVGHVGWILLAMCAPGEAGMSATMVYMSLYVCMSLVVFGVLLNLRSAHYGRRIIRLHELKGLGRSNPALAFCLSVCMLSMAGIPPLAGFASKALVLVAAVESHLYGIAFLGLLTSVVSTFYYLRIVSVMYFEGVPSDAQEWESIGCLQSVLIAGLTLFILCFGLWPQPVLEGAKYVGLSLVLR